MDELEHRVEEAKSCPHALNSLIGDYLPFIKKEAGKNAAAQIEYEDRVSLAMLVFSNCVQQYHAGRGGFISFASVCIRNRLIDEERKTLRLTSKRVPLHRQVGEGEEAASQNEDTASLQAYNRQQEQAHLAEEIERFTQTLQAFGVGFNSLVQRSPKQLRSRNLCLRLARFVAQDDALKEPFLRHHRLPQAKLAQLAGVSQKTVEKHRKYIVALTVVLVDDYPGIRAFLPQCGEAIE